MASKQFPVNEDYGALPSSAGCHYLYEFDRQSCNLMVRGKYDADADEGSGHGRRTYHTPLQYGYVF